VLEAPPTRILIIRPSALGDVARSVPLLARLHAAYPHASIHWLVQDTFAEVIAAHPALSAIVPFPRKAFAHWWAPPVAADLAEWLQRLHDARYDLVIDAQGLLRSALFTRFTGAPVRLGYANAREGAGLFGGVLTYTHTLLVPDALHAVDRMLALLGPLGLPTHPASEHEMRLHVAPDAQAALERDELADGPYAVFAPTTRWPAKQWPPERFAHVARALLESRRVERVVLVGARGEAGQIGPLLDAARAEPRIINLLGQTSLSRLMALISRAAMVIGSDSAAVHIATGLARPLVALFGPTDITRVGPYQREADVLQHLAPGEPLNHKATEPGRTQMARISAQEVTAAALARLEQPRPATSYT
jgi:lipopolysaccharide heptosyltransferase I